VTVAVGIVEIKAWVESRLRSSNARSTFGPVGLKLDDFLVVGQSQRDNILLIDSQGILYRGEEKKREQW